MVALTVATKQLDALSDAADRAVKELQYPKDFCPFGLVGRLLLHLAVLHGLQRAAARSGEFDKHTALEDCGCNVAVDYRELKKREGLG